MFRGKKANLEDCKGMPDYHLVMGDCAKIEVLERAEEKMHGVDCIFHLAAINGTRYFNERPDLVVRVNLDTIRTVSKFATNLGSRLVFTSSPEAFGEQPDMPLSETSPTLFPSPHFHLRHSYGASKYLGEVLLQFAVRERGLDARIIRPFNGYGPRLKGDDYGQVAAIFLNRCIREEPLQVHGDGTQTRSFTWVADLVDGIVAAGELDEGLDGSSLKGASFNLGSTEEVSLNDLAEVCLRISGSEFGMVHEGSHPGDSARRVPDVTAANSALGWSASVSIEDGISRCWSWLVAERDAKIK
jgi:nucleoside-diphosphate-sugar epimerase